MKNKKIFARTLYHKYKNRERDLEKEFFSSDDKFNTEGEVMSCSLANKRYFYVLFIFILIIFSILISFDLSYGFQLISLPVSLVVIHHFLGLCSWRVDSKRLIFRHIGRTYEVSLSEIKNTSVNITSAYFVINLLLFDGTKVVLKDTRLDRSKELFNAIDVES
jgi:hypothetical protein